MTNSRFWTESRNFIKQSAQFLISLLSLKFRHKTRYLVLRHNVPLLKPKFRVWKQNLNDKPKILGLEKRFLSLGRNFKLKTKQPTRFFCIISFLTLKVRHKTQYSVCKQETSPFKPKSRVWKQNFNVKLVILN